MRLVQTADESALKFYRTIRYGIAVNQRLNKEFIPISQPTAVAHSNDMLEKYSAKAEWVYYHPTRYWLVYY